MREWMELERRGEPWGIIWTTVIQQQFKGVKRKENKLQKILSPK